MVSEVDGIVAQLKKRKPLPPLVPREVWDAALSKEIAKLAVAEIGRAALYLWNDEIEKAHIIAQQTSTKTGSLVHGVLHRRQPDYTNAKYWLRQIGKHPVWSVLKKEMPGWDPILFVDQCQRAEKEKVGLSLKELETIQNRELELLVEHCFERERD